MPSARSPFETWSFSVVPKGTSSNSLFLRFLVLPLSATGGGRTRHLRALMALIPKKTPPQGWCLKDFGGHTSARRFWCAISMFQFARSSRSLAAACSQFNASATLSLKTCHRHVFLTLAFEPLMALCTKNKNHPMGGFVFGAPSGTRTPDRPVMSRWL